MKTYYFLLTLYLLTLTTPAAAQCGRFGDGKSAKMRTSDSLKNRSAITAQPMIIPIDSILRQPLSTDYWLLSTTFASITGYVVSVKYGGPESCNCKSTDKTDWDYHIVVAKDKDHIKPIDCMIFEVTRYNRADNPALTYAFCKSLVGHYATFDTWLFPDIEHWNAAENTHPGGVHNWRRTIWEGHSIKSITITH